MQHTIEVNGIKLYAFHGCLVEEEKIGGHYTVDVSIKTDFTASFASDELADTVDYVKINQVVREEMAIRSKLIEHVGYRISKRLQTEIKGLITSKVKVIKHCPPIGGDVNDVAIIIEN
ncbi:dihydroneopterin aldolase [Brumimicrobium oceani]|uniref:7,8-dihydroneopterin aldolase n=1 Tax=Brumimicrobium oceani TaxID=2100725 RepID=A0A2U2XAW2_9FLAO|nr:dihydroneopterin aldolase [Brumimicrobium oceani]PWH84922.1 dihydroneopterin aldolase [Brumimicrobium oceani]